MQITALIEVINYLKEISGNSSLIEGYKKLSAKVKEASENAESDFSSAILLEKDQLRHLLLESDPSDFGYSSYSLFEKINKNKLFGKGAADYLDNLFTSENKDYKSIYSDLDKRAERISKLSETLTQLQVLFKQVVPAEIFQISEDINNGSTLFLYFEGRLSVQNIADLERYARIWDRILNSFSRLTSEKSLTLDINSFRNGNIVLGVATKERTLDAIMTGITGISEVLSVMLKIRKIQVDIASLPFSNNLIELIEEEIQNLISQKALESAQKLIPGYPDSTFDSEEMINDISRSLKQILSFVEKGGKIEFRPLISNPEITKTNKALIESFAIAQELENVTNSLTCCQDKKEEKSNNGELGAPDEVTM